MEKDQRIKALLMKVAGFFMQNGIKSHTMDDISKLLGISKKTLYTFVANKNDLVNQAITLVMEDDLAAFQSIIEEAGNAIDHIFALNRRVSEKLQQMQPVVIYDLKNYYPEAWAIVEEYKCDFLLSKIEESLRVGIEEGLFREDLNVKIIATVNLNLIYAIFEDKMFPSHDFSFLEIHEEISNYHIRAVANEKGLLYINKLIEHNKKNRWKDKTS